MSSETEPSTSLLSRFDLLVMLGAVMALFVALGAEAWWTLAGASTTKLFSIQVSPFFVQIAATGMPSTVPQAAALGSFTRTFLLIGFVALFTASIRPTAWWRSFALYFGYAAIAELYLSFFLMLYWAESIFSSTYGTTTPFFGTSTIHANLIGLDFGLYTSPLVTATFGITAYLGLISIAFLLGRNVLNVLRQHAIQVLAALLPSGGVHDITLTPPYQQVWFSNTNDEYNPMRKYLGGATDDQLLISFGKLFETVEPGGSLSVILPEGSTILSDKLEKIMPEVGFAIEEPKTITSPQGKPEIELRFRRPEPKQIAEPVVQNQAPTLETPAEDGSAVFSPLLDNTPAIPSTIVAVPVARRTAELGAIPTLEVASQPLVRMPRMTRLERTILRSAVRAITERGQPVLYRELLNEVYMELVDQKIEFDSARQIETTLLSHNGREVMLSEEDDGSGHGIKKWSLGGQKIAAARTPRLPVLKRVKAVVPKITSIRRIIASPRKRGYRQTPQNDDENNDQTG